jgi:cellobiose phosphorylase
MILGLLRYGKVDDAYALFKRITPGYPTTLENDPKQANPPFVYANCFFGAEHRYNKFQMEYTWITGSVAWFNNVILQHILGARAEFGGLRIDPRLPSEWPQATVSRTYRGAVYNITIKNPDKVAGGKPVVTLDGKPIEGNLLPVFPAGTTHTVEVVMKAK